MSCEVRLVTCIEEIEKIRKYLFHSDIQNGSDNWLHSCKISVSPLGDLIVISKERKIVIVTPKWDAQSSTNSFQINFNKLIHDYDKVKAVLCLTVPGKNENFPDWTCILIGFDSGYVRCYTENCDLVYEEQFNAENIVTITCKKQRKPKHGNAQLEELYIQYQSVVCVLNGAQFISVLKNSPQNNQDVNLIPKKWGFQEQSVINDSAVVGLNVSNTFDHLLTASTCGGFHAKYRAVPPNTTLVIAAGSKPFLGYHYALEGGGQPVLSDVAKAVASKLKSTLPSWLVGTKNVQEKQVSYAAQPSDPMGCKFGLCDLRRAATDVILSPDHKLAAVCDTLGRILLVDSYKGIVLRIFKGYREGQCAFIQVDNERKSKSKIGNKVAHFLVIYSPKKGTVEVFCAQQGNRITTFSASKHSRLLYVNYSFEEFTKSSCTCLFLDENGSIKEIFVPFHFILSEKNNKRARDLHLYKKFRHLLKTGEIGEKLFKEALSICTEVKTAEVKSQILHFLLDNKNLSPDFILSCVQYFLESEETTTLKEICQSICVLLKLFIFLTNDAKNPDKEIEEDIAFNTGIKEMVNLQKLLKLSITNDAGNGSEPRVKFSDDLDFSVSEFVSIFDYSTSEKNHLKSNIDGNILFRASEVLFESYINGTATNFKEFEEKLIDSKISTKSLFDLLLTYWINRSLKISLDLEEEMKKFLVILNLIVKISEDDIDVVEYDQVSKFWSQIRNVVADSSRAFPALMAAILCKTVSQNFNKAQVEENGNSLDDMEVLTQEDIEWGLLIGKLEDISLLNIILSTKPTANDCPLPKLKHDRIDISLKYVLQKGRGSVSELVAQWLTTIGFNPKIIVLNQIEENPLLAEEKLLENFNLLKEQFPYSLEMDCVLTNMCWEYATAWQKDMQNIDLLNASIICLDNIQHLQIKQGIYQLLWNTHLKIVNENACKLINKVGKLPKERLCKQDTGLTDYQISLFLNISTEFLDSFMETAKSSTNVSKKSISFENIWDNGGKPLVELAMQQRDVNFDLLFLHYQLILVLLMTTTFSTKHLKPVNNLFDVSIVNLFFTDLQKKLEVFSNKSDVRLNSNRMQFLQKIITSSMESITKNDAGETYSSDHVSWMSKCLSLGKNWNLDADSLRRLQVVELFLRGFDSVAEELIPAVNESQELGKSLLAVAAKRLSQFLMASPQLAENIGVFSTSLTKFMQNLNDEWCAPTTLKEITMLSTHILHCLTEEDPEYKLAVQLLDACEALEEVQS